MEILGIILSSFAIILSVYTYLKHDKEIKQQSFLINKYQLEKIIKEKEEEKKALIEANVISGQKGTKIIKVYNRGKSIARNVNIIIPENDGYHVFANPSPIEIRPKNGIEINLSTYMGNRPDKIRIEFEWEDDFSLKNTGSQTIQL